MSPYVLTSSPAESRSSVLPGTASPAHDSLRLAFPTTSSETHLQTPAIPTHASIYLQREWAIPAGCDFPGASFFSSQFANSKSFPTSLFSGHWDAGAGGCTWVDTSSATATSPSTLPSPTSASTTPSHARLSTNAIIGIAVSAGVIAILLATGLVFCVMRRRHRRHALSESGSASASLIPVAYPILPQQRRRGSRGTTRLGASSPPPSEVHVEAHTSMSERFGVGDSRHVESSSLAKCSIAPRLSASSPLHGSVGAAAQTLEEGPCRAEKALMQLRDMDRRPHPTAPPPTYGHGIRIVPETRRQTANGETGSYDLGGGVAVSSVLDSQEADEPGGVVRSFNATVDYSPNFDPGLDSDSDSKTTLPPPYSSNPSLG